MNSTKGWFRTKTQCKFSVFQGAKSDSFSESLPGEEYPAYGPKLFLIKQLCGSKHTAAAGLSEPSKNKLSRGTSCFLTLSLQADDCFLHLGGKE